MYLGANNSSGHDKLYASSANSPDTAHATQSAMGSGTTRLHDPVYAEMYNTLQQMLPPPTLDANRAQVPDDAWNFKQGWPSYGLDLLLQTPMAKEMGLKLREQFGNVFPGKSELGWAGTALIALLTKGMHGNPGEIAGFDFDAKGKNLSDRAAANVFSQLKQHLIDTNQTTPELASAISFMLLWQSAPVYLLKDIPADVDRFDSYIWDQVRRVVSDLTSVDEQATLSKSYDDILDILDPRRVADRNNLYI